MNYPHVATIRKSTKVGTQYPYADTGTTECFLQPLNAERAQLYGLVFAKAFNCFLPLTADVSEKSRLVIDGVTYGVKGVKTHNYGTLAHKVAILELTV